MKRFIILLLFILCVDNSYSKGTHKMSRPTGTSLSIDDIDENKDRLVLNYEQDSYRARNTEYTNPQIMYSTHGWDFGIIAQNIVLQENTSTGQTQNFQNDVYIEINKTFKWDDVVDTLNCGNICDYMSVQVDVISTTVGTQNGTVFPMSTSADPNHLNYSTLHQFYFLDNDFELIKNRFALHGGIYYTNQALSTTTNYIGYLFGTEIMIYPKLLKFDVDFFSGRSNVSGTILQTTWTINKNFELFCGMGLATSGSGNYSYMLTGINVIKLFDP